MYEGLWLYDYIHAKNNIYVYISPDTDAHPCNTRRGVDAQYLVTLLPDLTHRLFMPYSNPPYAVCDG